MIARVCWLGLLVLHAFAGTAAAAPIVHGSLGQRIDAWMSAAADHGLSGSLLVEKDGEVLVLKGYGLADREAGTPAADDTRYVIGSLSKTFTAAAVLKLESMGRLRTTDSLPAFFSGVPADKRGITVAQLLSHTSGLPYLPSGSLFDAISRDSMVREILTLPLAFEPGSKWQYSSPGFNLLAAIVERASGTRFETFLHAELFAPAGMTETSFFGESASTSARAARSYSSPQPDPPFAGNDAAKTAGAGNMVSTVGDLWRWEQALRGERVLTAEAKRKLFSPVVDVTPTLRFSMGWNVARSARGTTVFMHAGDLGGFNADMRRMVDEKATVAFLSNARAGGRGYREAVAPPIIKFLTGDSVLVPPRRATLTPAALERFAGAWKLSSGGVVRARVVNGALELSGDGQDAVSALAGSDSAARAREQELTARAGETARWLIEGRVDSLSGRFSAAIPEPGRVEVVRTFAAQADSLGRPRVVSVGNASSTPATARSFVRVRGDRGERVWSLDWVGGQLMGLDTDLPGMMPSPFVAESPARVARYDVMSGRLVRATLDAAGRTLTLESAGRRTTASRVSSAAASSAAG